MTIQQLEYIIAVDNYRHFAKAAEACFVTQPTLSMMIQKLEEELGVKIFDRLAHPVAPTVVGTLILQQARASISSFMQIKEIVNNEKNLLGGDFKIGIIPTVATYLVPELLKKINESALDIHLIMQEVPTTLIIDSVLHGKLDGGLAATPLNNPLLTEIPIYYEKFYAYTSPLDTFANKKEIDLQSIDIQDVWLLENVHCLRGQVLNLCKRKKDGVGSHQTVRYESGTLDTLINIVDYNGGLTVIPELTAMSLPEEKQANLRKIKDNSSVREISLVVRNDFVRQTVTNAIVGLIKETVPKSMQDAELKKHVIGIN